MLVATEAADVRIGAFLRAKWQRRMKLFATWTEEDILAFSRQSGRYVDGMREQYPGQG